MPHLSETLEVVKDLGSADLQLWMYHHDWVNFCSGFDYNYSWCGEESLGPDLQ